MTDETDDREPKPAPRRRDDSEKAIGLEMARLFGLNPKLMMAPNKPKPDDREPFEPEDGASESGGDSG